MTGLTTLPMNAIRCDACRGSGMIRKYPRDSQWCARCKGSGQLPVHPSEVLGYGCNRCQYTWDKPLPPYCGMCGADATHYRLP